MSPETKFDISKADLAFGQQPDLSSTISLRDRSLISRRSSTWRRQY
jgi:hypothetical protein